MTDTNRASLEEIIATFRCTYVRPQSVAAARCKWEQLHFDSSRQTLQDFLEQYQKLAQEAYGHDAPKFIETSFYAKMPLHLKRVLNQARLETESYDTVVQHLEREMELNGLSALVDTNITGLHQIKSMYKNVNKPTQTSRSVLRPGMSLRTAEIQPARQGTGATGCPTKSSTHAKLVARKATQHKNAAPVRIGLSDHSDGKPRRQHPRTTSLFHSSVHQRCPTSKPNGLPSPSPDDNTPPTSAPRTNLFK